MQRTSLGDAGSITDYLDSARSLVIDELTRVLPEDSDRNGGLYGLALEYPLRQGKAIRPALCIAACRLFGGELHSIARTAAVLELFHNAFLIHDDVEDESILRRSAETLHRMHGRAIAINVGDGMLALCMDLLLGNLELLGVGRSLRILDYVARMSRETAEGQMMELRWIQQREFHRTPSDYLRMVYKKTAWYSFIAPMLIGAAAAGSPEPRERALHRFAALLGIAFQIRDDVLNLAALERDSSRPGPYGKEAAGDLWEGKLTLVLMHALRRCSEAERQRAVMVLSRSRGPDQENQDMVRRLVGLEAFQKLPEIVRSSLVSDLVERQEPVAEDIEWLRSLIDRTGSLEYADTVATRHALRARDVLGAVCAGLGPSAHREFLESLVDYVVLREL